MKRRRIGLALIICLMVGSITAYSLNQKTAYTKYSRSFFTFDTVVQVIGYAKNQSTFDKAVDEAEALFAKYHALYDNYHAYDSLVNIYTLNHNAADGPVAVPRELFDLIAYCKQEQPDLNNTVNIALGAVLKLWHDAREAFEQDPAQAKLPDIQALRDAAAHTNMDDVILDAEQSTVYYNDPLLQLDVGAVAKGYATELVAQHLLQGSMPSFIINAGGNVRTGHPPLDGRKNWGVAIQDPDNNAFSTNDTNIIETLFLHDLSVVTSGDYQRYFMHNGIRYHHIISPKTLMPSANMRSVTIITKDSGYADLLSTAVFLMSYEEGRAFVDNLEGVECVWVMNDRSLRMTKGAEQMARSFGASGNK
ncbi:MAG: FAD:protein FMN transferase [Christensenellales bacterium]|jgi:thiamine biosynthesis lipoprotein